MDHIKDIVERQVARLEWYQSERQAMSQRTGLETGDETLVQQQFKEEVDINTIMRRFGVTGEWPSHAPEGLYGDFTGVSDLATALERVEAARKGFMELPPEVRERFKNDPLEFLAFAENVDDEELSEQLGMFVAPPGGSEGPLRPSAVPVEPPQAAQEGDKPSD